MKKEDNKNNKKRHLNKMSDLFFFPLHLSFFGATSYMLH